MAAVRVLRGLIRSKLTLPNAQILLVGRHKLLKNLVFDEALAEKLAGVDEKLFNSAIKQLQPDGQVPIYLDQAKFISVSDEVSRYNSPSNAYAIFRELSNFKPSKGTKGVSVILFADYDHVVPTVVAAARAFPTFSRKTTKSEVEDIQVEVIVTGDKDLTEEDLKFLNNITEATRECAELVDTPCNELHSTAWVEKIVKYGQNFSSLPISTSIISGEELRKQGFGGIYNVGKAAANPPAFVCMSYKPAGATEDIAIVGKGIMFDTGGMQIKGKTGMPGMKRDMGGAAAVYCAFWTLVQSGFKQNLHCILCIAENNVSPLANRPDDIITLLSGKTVEINNTDAEGRLVLADGVFYAKNTLKAKTIIDLATLTGAQAYASGQQHAAILCSNDEIETAAIRAGKKSGDLVHPLPFAPDLHFPDLKSAVADMKNSNLGSMQGPPSSIAGLFIGANIDFGADVNWLHVDIAAPAVKGERATAYGIPLICSLLGKFVDVPVLK